MNAVADHDGFDACRYLTRRSLLEVHAVEPPGTSCEAVVSSSAQLVLGTDRVDTQAAVKALHYRVGPAGAGRVRVTVSASGAGRTFVLRRGTRGELGEFEAPPTPWRIDSGLAGLVAR